MLVFILKRIGFMLLTMLVVSILLFLLLEIDVRGVATMVLGPYSSEEQRDIWLQQARWAAEDYGRFWLTTLGRPGDPAPFNSLIEDRSTHIASGIHEFGSIIERECVPLSKIWSDYFGTVMRDWRAV